MKINEFYMEMGQDYQEVLERVMGSETFLAMLLYSFKQDETFETLQNAVESGETKEIFNCAHTLKGLTLNLGLRPLYENLVTLVELTRNGETEGVGEAFAHTAAAYREVRKLLSAVEGVKEA